MDAIGLMVTGIVDGFLTLTQVGGLDQRILPGQRVIVHPADSKNDRPDLPGIIVRPPEYLLPVEVRGKSTPIEYLLVDTGLDPLQVENQIQIGDLVSFAQPPIEFGEDYLAGHTLDNRVSVAALTCCLEELQNRSLAWDVWAVATSQEEETMAGAFTSSFQLRPTLAVAIDVTFGDGAGSSGHKTFPIGKGITLGWGPNIHPALHKKFAGLADRLEIPWKLEPVPRMSGTDAYGMQVAAEGIPTMVIGIPLRYMHTPVEMVSIKDILRTGRLLAEFAASLDQNAMDRIVWDA
jgi:endoglucanase